jgi:hypothetical protein
MSQSIKLKTIPHIFIRGNVFLRPNKIKKSLNRGPKIFFSQNGLI